MKLYQLSFIIFLFSVYSCKKENAGCYQLAYNGSVVSDPICDKSKSEIEAQAGAGYFVFKASEKRYCWKIVSANGSFTNYHKDLPESVLNHFYNTNGNVISKVDCSSFCAWEVQTKSRSKITGNYLPTTVKVEFYEGAVADTCSKLFEGRVVTVRETTDSLITATYIKERK